MTYAFIQKSCIWLLSIVPFSVFSYVAMRGHGPHPTGASVLSIFYCMLVLAACMYLAEQWVQLWNLEDQEDRDARQAKLAAEQARQDAWLAEMAGVEQYMER